MCDLKTENQRLEMSTDQ